MKPITAPTHVYGDHIDTDRIIPGKYTKTLDMSQLAAHVLEDLDPTFKDRVQPGDILVAGDNFGCGSSREQAPLALKAAGVSVVVAAYFARIFYRNAINVGLPLVEIGVHTIQPGSILQVDLLRGEVVDETAVVTYRATKMPEVMLAILQAGGLVNYLKENGRYLPGKD
ncbi:3-isopropylmalate dehydratase [Candidatus Leptofilum sp.]|uniref:LeuD/DmdB family oxidoreductase small subunit n=1 Tax=Candidatus Leptofilum sp. TaxID=3241576 RepID=UPI003B59EAAB